MEKYKIQLTQKEIDLIFDRVTSFKKLLKEYNKRQPKFKEFRKLMGVSNSILKKLNYITAIIH